MCLDTSFVETLRWKRRQAAEFLSADALMWEHAAWRRSAMVVPLGPADAADVDAAVESVDAAWAATFGREG